MKVIPLLIILLVCTACAQTSGFDRDDREYKRIDYMEAVFLPVTRACRRAGGYMVFEDMSRNSIRPAHLTYTDMRKAVSKGCAGT